MLIFRGLPGGGDPHVKIGVFNFQTTILFDTLNLWSIEKRKAVIINAMDNGVHGANTLHGLSLAWDLGIEGYNPDDFVDLTKYLKMRLPPPYEVVMEQTHIHVEWDTHQGR